MNNLTINNIGGNLVKDTDVYRIQDNTDLKQLVVSSTLLYPGKSTRGHTHAGQEEVYMFISGTGTMQLDKATFPVSSGDMILIQDGVFHKVSNDSDGDLYFVCVFNSVRSH